MSEHLLGLLSRGIPKRNRPVSRMEANPSRRSACHLRTSQVTRKSPGREVRALNQGQLQALGAMEIVRADTQRARKEHLDTVKLNNSCTGMQPGRASMDSRKGTYGPLPQMSLTVP
jgi:hypothetical protein